MTQALEEYRARMRRELSAAAKQDLLCEVRAIQNARGWDYDRAFRFVLAQSPGTNRGTVEGGFTKTAVIVQAQEPLTRDPRLAEEMAKHKRLEDSKQADAIDGHIARMARIRKLRVATPNLSFDQAFTHVCQEETGTATPTAATHTLTIMPAARPQVVEAEQKKERLILIEGAKCGMVYPIARS